MAGLETLRLRLRALRRRVAAALALDGAARLAAALLGAVALSFLLDRVFELETGARAVLLGALLAGLGWIAWRYLVRRLRALPGEEPLAIAVEARFPELGDRLISALQLARLEDPERYGVSPQLVEDAISRALEPAARLPFERVVARRRVARRAALGALALVLLAGAAAADPATARLWFLRNVLLRDVRWPRKTHLVVDRERFRDGVARIVRGADFAVTARSVGEVHPERVTIFWKDSEGERGEAAMKADLVAHTYRYEFRAIAFPFAFHLEGGDDVTETFRIELMEPPEVAELHLQAGFPAYAARAPEPIDLAQGDPELLAGGFLVIAGRSSKPLRSARLVLGELAEEGPAFRLTAPDRFELTYRPERTELLGLRLVDRDGLSNPSLAPRFLVRVHPDRPPRLRFRPHGVGPMVVAGAVVPYRLRATDDVALTRGRIEIRVSAEGREAAAPHVIPLPAQSLGGDHLELEDEIELGPLGIHPGAFLVFRAFATDNARPEAHEGRSDSFTIKVVTLEELFSELTRRQQEERRRFEELLARERRLRDRLLDLRDAPPASASELQVRLEGQGQEQREIARRVRGIERALEQILDEMYSNRLAGAGRIQVLRRQVVDGLRRLERKIMPGHAARLDEAARRAAGLDLPGADGAELEAGYQEVLKAMEAVLARMIKVEGFTEIVQRVRELVEEHRKLEEATRRAYEERLRRIFRDKPAEPKQER